MLEDFFKEALDRNDTFLDMLEEGVVPSNKVIADFARATKFDAIRISSEYIRDVINREQVANEIFEGQVGS